MRMTVSKIYFFFYFGYLSSGDLDAVTVWISSCWNYGAANIVPPQEDLTPPLIEEEAPFLKHMHI
jgi:hypothetical protein